MKLAAAALILLATLGTQARPTRPSTVQMKATIYDDGLSCPGGCDAHVVFHPRHNGTATASDPSATRGERTCTPGRSCRICFAAGDESCMTATYRGGGPPPGTFDFTPAFYAKNCGRSGLPDALSGQCASLGAAVRRLGYDHRVNCLQRTEDPACRPVLAAATAARSADEPEYAGCRLVGEAAYNRAQANPARRRANGCAYTALRTGGPNARGVTWRRLLPAACRPGTFAGRDGLDCCSGDLRFAASAHPECSAFHPRQR